FLWNPVTNATDIANWGPNGLYADNYLSGQESAITSKLDTVSAALFTQLDFALTDRLHLLPGLRYNYDQKQVDWAQRLVFTPPPVAPGAPPPPNTVYSDSTAVRDEDDTNVSGQLTLSFDASDRINYYATYATAFKSIGVNLGGGPAIQIPPEDVTHLEIGLKSTPRPGTIANLTLFNTVIENFQTQVLIPGNNRPVIASAEEVRVRGIELDGSTRIGDSVSLYGGIAYSDAEYTS